MRVAQNFQSLSRVTKKEDARRWVVKSDVEAVRKMRVLKRKLED